MNKRYLFAFTLSLLFSFQLIGRMITFRYSGVFFLEPIFINGNRLNLGRQQTLDIQNNRFDFRYDHLRNECAYFERITIAFNTTMVDLISSGTPERLAEGQPCTNLTLKVTEYNGMNNLIQTRDIQIQGR